jgi:hypothetical protein
MSSLLVTLFVAMGFMATWQLASWDANSDVALESSPDGGQIIIDRLSPSFRVLPIQEMDGSWSYETRSSFATPMIRPFSLPDQIARDCARCMDNPEALSFVVPFFGVDQLEDSVMRSSCITRRGFRYMSKTLVFVGLMVCVPRPGFEDISNIQKCGHPHLPFAYSPSRFNCSTGKS